jgi:transposase InsO family protein
MDFMEDDNLGEDATDPSTPPFTWTLLFKKIWSYMNGTSTKDDDISQTQKLDPPKIGPFNGSSNTWDAWHMSTRVTFLATGFGQILTDPLYASANPNRNKIVFAQLAHSTSKGHAYHLVQKHEFTQDGHLAWQDLLEWYEGTHAHADNARSLRQKLDTLFLHPGNSASEYINEFMTNIHTLSNIKDERLSDSDAKSRFLTHILDPDYKALKEDLENNINQHSLKDLVDSIRRKERTLLADKGTRKRFHSVRRTITSLDSDSDIEEPAAKKRKKKRVRKTSGAISLPSTLVLTQKGKIRIDPKDWRQLEKSHKNFVLDYNKAVSHSETPPTPPSGVTIQKTRRVRREKNLQPTLPSVLHNPSVKPPNSEDEDADETSLDLQLLKPKQRKGVTFHLTDDPPTRDKKRRLQHLNNKPRRQPDPDDNSKDILILDSGGGKRPTITKRGFRVLAHTGRETLLSGYQEDGPPKLCPVVHGVTKAHIVGRDRPFLLFVNNATLVEDPGESESLLTLFDMYHHGIEADPKPTQYGGNCRLTVDGEHLPFEFDGEKIFFSISKPSDEDLELLDEFELNSMLCADADTPGAISSENIRRKRKREQFETVPLSEWSRRLGYRPDDVVRKTLDATTQHYMEIEAENSRNPKRHFRARFPALKVPRQREAAATDTAKFNVKTSQGHTCSQFFSGLTSKRWYVHPLKKESHNFDALADYTRQVGAPTILHSDNAQSETGTEWTRFLRQHCIGTHTSEPNYPWQNPAEQEIGRFWDMVRLNMRESGAPIGMHHWCQKFCEQVNNVVARRSLHWKTPMEMSTGETTDISAFRHGFWDPIWIFDPSVKAPRNNLHKARYLCIADTCGDAMSYYVYTEPPKGKGRVLIRSVIRTRRHAIGTPDEHINNDPNLEDLTLTDNEQSLIRQEGSLGQFPEIPEDGEDTDDVLDTEVEEPLDAEESLPADSGSTNILDTDAIDELNDEGDGIDNEHEYEFHEILSHRWHKSKLLLKVKYITVDNLWEILEVPWTILKRDVPVELARYIKNKVVDTEGRHGTLSKWATQVLTHHVRNIKRLYRAYQIDFPGPHHIKVRRAGARRATLKRKLSKNARNAEIFCWQCVLSR